MPSMNHSGSRSAPFWPGAMFGPRRDVELKRVDELVADHVIGVGERTAERQDDAAPQRLGDAAGAFAELALNRVGLLEVGMRRVQHERLAAAQLVREQLLEPRVPPFRHPRRDVDPFTLVRVVVDVEVLGLQNLKIELLVLDLVLPKYCADAGAAQRRQRPQRRQRFSQRDRWRVCKA